MILKKIKTVSELQAVKDEFESSTGKKFKEVFSSIETDVQGNILKFETDDGDLQKIVKSKGLS